MADYEFYYEQYRRAPRNSISNQKDLLDFNSTISISTYNIWSMAPKRPLTTTYIDGSALLGLHDRPYSAKGSFPKGKSRRKPCIPCEKKINTGDVYMSLVPADKANLETATVRSEKNRSPLSMATATATHNSSLPDQPGRSTGSLKSRIYSATVYDDDVSEPRFYARCGTTHATSGWVQRYKSINQSHALTDLLRDQANKDKMLLKKKANQQLFHSSSSQSAFATALMRRRRAKY